MHPVQHGLYLAVLVDSEVGRELSGGSSRFCEVLMGFLQCQCEVICFTHLDERENGHSHKCELEEFSSPTNAHGIENVEHEMGNRK